VSFGFTAVTNGYGDWNYGCFNSTTINASSSWDIGATFATTGVCGGAATVTATYGSYPQQSLTFSILGNSGVPDKGTVNGFIGSSPWFLHQIVQAESAYQQFVANGWPKFGGPNGFGLMQVDPPSGAFQIWDWTQNATAGLAILAGFNATAYWTRQVRNWQLFNSSNPAYTAAPPANTVEGPCTFSYNPTGGAYPFSDAVWIKRYNAGTNQEYIQFTPGTNSNGNPQGVWDVEPLNGNNLDYVQAVCSATP